MTLKSCLTIFIIAITALFFSCFFYQATEADNRMEQLLSQKEALDIVEARAFSIKERALLSEEEGVEEKIALLLSTIDRLKSRIQLRIEELEAKLKDAEFIEEDPEFIEEDTDFIEEDPGDPEFLEEDPEDLEDPEPKEIETEDLEGVTVISPNGIEETIEKLDTSKKLAVFLSEHFQLTPREGSSAQAPEEFFAKREGGEQDFAVFAAYTLYQNKFTSFIFVYEYDNGSKRSFVTSFRDTDLPRYMYFNKDGAHLVHHGWSFEDLCQTEERRRGIEITRYGVVSPLSTELDPEEWRER